MIRFVLASLATAFAAGLSALGLSPPERPFGTPRVLVVTMDGVEVEALDSIWTPMLDGLRADGAYTDRVRSGATLARGSRSDCPAAPRPSARTTRSSGSAGRIPGS